MANKYFNMFTAKFENTLGEDVYKDIEADSLEDATIEATTMAEENGWEMLSIDYSNKNL